MMKAHDGSYALTVTFTPNSEAQARGFVSECSVPASLTLVRYVARFSGGSAENRATLPPNSARASRAVMLGRVCRPPVPSFPCPA